MTKCFVGPCPNSKGGGKFKNNVCMPCWMYAAAVKRNENVNWNIPVRSDWIDNNLHEVLVQSRLEHSDVYYISKLKERINKHPGDFAIYTTKLDERILEPGSNIR